MPTQQDVVTANQVLSNLLRIQFLLNVIGPVMPTQAQVDQLAAVGVTTNLLGAKPTYSKDGVSYDFAGYLAALDAAINAKMEQIPKMDVLANGPFEYVSRGYT